MSQSPSPSTEIVYRNCSLCEAHCGIGVEVDRSPGRSSGRSPGRAPDRGADRIVTIRGDAEDSFSRGYICPKAYALKGLHEDPDRLRRPVRRVGQEWHELDWDEAFDLVATRLRQVRDAHGPAALGSYAGNPSVHDLGANLYLPALLRGLGNHKRFSASSVDQLPKQLSSLLMYGRGLLIPVPDVDRTSYFLVLGANPVVSNGSLMTAPDMPGRLARLRARGGKLVVIDPRRSETAAVADEHHFIRPGTDAFFLFSLVHVLFAENLVDLGRVAPHVRGLEDLRALAQDFPPEATAARTGIDAGVVRRLAREFAAAESAACYGRLGTCTQEFGTLSSWLVDCVTILTGNLDTPGGAMFPRSATEMVAEGPRQGPRQKTIPYGRWRSSVRGLPEAFGELPSAALAEEIEGNGSERIRALVTVAGNPVLSCPNGDRLARALASLEFMVSVDIYINETTRFADVILPPRSPLEQTSYELVFSRLAVRNVAKLSPPVFEPAPDTRDQWRILAEIAGRFNGVPADVVDEMTFSAVASKVVGPGTACPEVSVAQASAAVASARGPERILDLLLRAGPYGDRFDAKGEGLSLQRLREAVHGVDLGPLEPRLPELLATESRAIELAPPLIASDVPRLRARLDAPASVSAHPRMQLIGRRQLRSNNSWMGNIHSLAKGRERCTLLVHPSDAERLGLLDGGRAVVRSRVGELIAPVAVSSEVMPGVVSLPHGFGHDAEGARLGVAREHAGVNTNLLTDEAAVDALSGNGVLNGIPVEIHPAP
jgi:anaerobic selenocysteine-containing dehydrogenase